MAWTALFNPYLYSFSIVCVSQWISICPVLGSKWFPHMGVPIRWSKSSSQSDEITKGRPCSLYSYWTWSASKNIWETPSVQTYGHLLALTLFCSSLYRFDCACQLLHFPPVAPLFLKSCRLGCSLLCHELNSTPSASAHWSYQVHIFWRGFHWAAGQTWSTGSNRMWTITGSGWVHQVHILRAQTALLTMRHSVVCTRSRPRLCPSAPPSVRPSRTLLFSRSEGGAWCAAITVVRLWCADVEESAWQEAYGSFRCVCVLFVSFGRGLGSAKHSVGTMQGCIPFRLTVDRQTESVSVLYGCTLSLNEILMAPEHF